MISSRTSQLIPKFDEIIVEEDTDFKSSGLKESIVIRISRLAVVDRKILLGVVGEIDTQRLTRIKNRLSNWIKGVELAWN